MLNRKGEPAGRGFVVWGVLVIVLDTILFSCLVAHGGIHVPRSFAGAIGVLVVIIMFLASAAFLAVGEYLNDR